MPDILYSEEMMNDSAQYRLSTIVILQSAFAKTLNTVFSLRCSGFIMSIIIQLARISI